MRRTRVIPVLLLKGNGFYKTTKFSKPVYLGDPLNILRIFNEKEVDEIIHKNIYVDSTKIESKKDSEFFYNNLINFNDKSFLKHIISGGGQETLEVNITKRIYLKNLHKKIPKNYLDYILYYIFI